MDHLLEFIDASPSPFHAVEAIRGRLDAAGFKPLQEADQWTQAPHTGYYVIRGGKTIAAWKTGGKPLPDAGFRILGGHTDSPTIKVRPNPEVESSGQKWLAVDVYGGPLLYTWLDRDVKLAGVVYAKGAKTGQVAPHWVDLAATPVRAVSLAIHLTRGNRGADGGLLVNPQKDLNLIFADSGKSVGTGLADVLAKACKLKPAQIIGFDLRAADAQPSCYVGADQAFVSAPRLDNLFSCYTTLEALLTQAKTKHDHAIMGVWFDAEEVGSETSNGADSELLNSLLTRIVNAFPQAKPQDAYRAKARSAMASVDMAHAEHPAFKQMTDENHVPQINRGLALKHSPSANYGDGGALAAWFRNACATHKIPLQLFAYRCDHGGGSSIGRFTSSHTGVRTIDVGAPMLSMHACRELAGRKDVALSIRALNVFLSEPADLK